MNRPPQISLEELAERYDVFFIDQFGVLRDDIEAYPGAREALTFLRQRNKRVVILSNSGRSGEFNSQRLAKLGFDQASFDFFVTSGDVAYDILSNTPSLVTGSKRCMTISSGGDENLTERLGMTSTTDASNADLVIISGSEAEKISMSIYREMLKPAADRGVPCYCTNPDRLKLSNGTLAPGAGSIALLYEGLGGDVTWLGKPHIEIYRHALSIASVSNEASVVCIGDSIEHDIAGAATAQLASVLVRTGIHSDLRPDELTALLERASVSPTFVMSSFSP